ncbi:MAG: hypothetical protein JSV00_09705 [bacterium]|nr:MAG: hypothetical protein JSV00_09705 [bacterium]
MKTRGFLLPILALLAAAACVPATGRAQGLDEKDPGIGLNLSVAVIEQAGTDVGDSEMDLSGYLVQVEKNLVQNRRLILGFSASYGMWNYTFAGPPADTWNGPWGKVRSVGGGLAIIAPGSGKWSYFLAPVLDCFWEEGADAADGLVSGAVAAAVHSFRHDRRLGLGAGVFKGLEDTMVFPFISVSWQLNEDLALQNPLSAGPAGPAGLELVYDPSGTWQIGGGWAYTSFRFRLDDEGVGPDGVGEISGINVWVRASWQVDPKVKLGAYAGASLAGDAVIEDSNGRELESEHVGPTPLAAVTMEWKF